MLILNKRKMDIPICSTSIRNSVNSTATIPSAPSHLPLARAEAEVT